MLSHSLFDAGKGRQVLPYRSGRRFKDGCPVWLDEFADHESSPLPCPPVKEVSISTMSLALRVVVILHPAKAWLGGSR